MAYSSSSSSSSTSSSSFQNQKGWEKDITITQEELFSFHNTDRDLFARLVFKMRCAPMEAMNIVAFWMWLERLYMAHYVAIINTYSDILFKTVFEETLVCLKVVESDTLVHYSYEVSMLKIIVGKVSNRVIDLEFIHNNRARILLDIGHIVKETCLRAFQDLIPLAVASMSYTPIDQHRHNLPGPSALGVRDTPNLGVIGGGRVGGFRPIPPHNLSSNYGGTLSDAIGEFVNYLSLKNRVSEMNNVPYLKGEPSNVLNHNTFQGVGASSSNHGSLFSVKYGLERESQSQFQQGNNENSLFEDNNPNVLPCERTIFLTFSRGYPISEIELREFINRSFGDIIETIHMQQVGENEQPLYARLVVRDARAMNVVLSERRKTKFAINGKHVWARKYVPKNPHSPPTTPIYNV